MLQNKVAIITGSSQGIGKAVARELLNSGAKVVINARSTEKLNKAFEELKKFSDNIIAVQGDVTIFEDCEKLINETIQKFGQIDILINNAGSAALQGNVEDLLPEIFEKVMKTNFLGSVYPTKCALPHIKKTKGSIIFHSSSAGIIGLPGYSAYSASKMSLTALAESLKVELAGTGVHIGINYIGFTENDADKKFFNKDGSISTIPKRENVKVEKVENVANNIIRGIKKRKFKKVFSVLGKTIANAKRIIPGLLIPILVILNKKGKFGE